MWGGKDCWLSLALVIDYSTRQLLGRHLSRTGKASTASAALEQAMLTRFGALGRLPEAFLLRSDDGLVFPSRDYTRLVAQLRPEAGIRRAALPAAERDGGTGHPEAEESMRASTPVREPGPRHASNR